MAALPPVGGWEESPNSAGQGASEEEDPITSGDGKCNRKQTS